jgi:uncharacterized glyoxalase superfamily protein PhnB
MRRMLNSSGWQMRWGSRMVEPLAARPWGQTDFRLIDPDGYYVRVTSAG